VTRSVENLLGDEERMGDVGVSPGYAPALAAVSRTDSPVWKAGLRTGDVITSMAGRPIVRREEIDAVLAGRGGAVDVAFRSGAKVMRGRLSLGQPLPDGRRRRPPQGSRIPRLFISSGEARAGGEAGARAGDRLVAIDGKPVSGWKQFTEAVRGSHGRVLSVSVRRDGEEKTFRVTPGRRFNADPLAKESRIYYIGVGTFSPAPGLIESRRVLNPVKAFMLGLREAWQMSVMTVRGMVKLFTGEVRIDNIGGPIQIGKVAADAAEDGLYTFLRMMAFISINLGILNLLPIPILDGGHLLFFLIESVKREPISVRKKEFAQQVGLTMLLLLIGVAFYNDIARSWDQIVGFLKDVRLRFM
jgi:regulator of sigma E protease